MQQEASPSGPVPSQQRYKQSPITWTWMQVEAVKVTMLMRDHFIVVTSVTSAGWLFKRKLKEADEPFLFPDCPVVLLRHDHWCSRHIWCATDILCLTASMSWCVMKVNCRNQSQGTRSLRLNLIFIVFHHWRRHVSLSGRLWWECDAHLVNLIIQRETIIVMAMRTRAVDTRPNACYLHGMMQQIITCPADPGGSWRHNKYTAASCSEGRWRNMSRHKGVCTGYLGLMMKDAPGEGRQWLIAWSYKRAC